MPYKDEYARMSAQRELERKAGRSISAATAHMIEDHCANIKGMADTMKQNMQSLHKALHGAANNLASRVAPSEPEEDGDEQEDQEQEKPGKSTVVSSEKARNAQQSRPSPEDTANEEEAAAALLALFKK